MVSIRVAAAVPVSDLEVASFALPPGFPIVVCESDHAAEPIVPINEYLFSRFAPVRKNLSPTIYSRNTALAVAFDLRDWWEFLEHEGLTWQSATQESLESYRDIMLNTHSATTARRYAITTVRRRMHSVLAFYDWAENHALVRTKFDRLPRIAFPVAQDQVALAHVSTKPREVHEIYPQGSRTRWDNVFAFDKSQYQRLTGILGPLPRSSRKTDDPHFRLLCEFALQTGTRISETTAITLSQISRLLPATEHSTRTRYLLITHTKGGRPRKIAVPNWLSCEIENYITRFRNPAVAAYVRAGGKLHDALFVYGPDSRHHVGSPQRARSASARFSRSVVRAGFLKRIEKRHPDTGQLFECHVPEFWFHCLRHTFAIWSAMAAMAQGRIIPWKTIQSSLGHKYLSTTTDLYGNLSGEMEPRVSDRMQERSRNFRRRRRDNG